MVGMAELPQIAITFVLVAALFVAGFLVVGGLGDSTTDVDATSAVANVTTGMLNVVTYAPIWGTIIGVAVLLGIVIAGFAFGRSRGMI